MKIQVFFFGQLREVFKQDETVFETQKETTVAQVVASLFESIQGVKSMNIAFAVNDEIVKKNCVLVDGDSLALLPPVAGG